MKGDKSGPINDSDRRYWLRVSNHNFHDATLERISIVPAASKRKKARIEVQLSVPHVELLFSLTFIGCTNVSLALDFDVLADQLPYNTAGHATVSGTAQIQEFVRSHVDAWNVRYEDTGSRSFSCDSSGISPLPAKLAKAASLTLHQVRYFGGMLSITATSLKVRRLKLSRAERNG